MPETILSVDGDVALICVRNEVLRKAKFEVIEAVAEPDVLKLASEKQPALIVLAVESAGIDGFAACRRLKGDPRTASIPVLHIARPGEPYRGYRESLESGADTYLQEPVEPPVLIAVATGLIRASRGGARTADRDAPSNDRLAALIDSIPDEVWFADSQRRFTLANASALREFQAGASPLVDVEDLARSLEVFRADGSPRPLEEAPPLRALRGETVRDQEEIVRTPVRGELRYRQVSASPVRDALGNIAGSVSVVRDITERKRGEEALAASEERYRTLFDTLVLGFALCEIICDEAGKPRDYRHLAVNRTFERQTGLKAGDFPGRTQLELFPGTEPVWFERYGKVALSGEPARFEASFGPVGRYFEVSVFQTEPGRFGVVFTDITERKRLADQLRERVEELETVMKAAPVAIWVAHDPQCQEITGNRMADQFYEADEEENVSANVTGVRRFFQGGRELEPWELPMQEATARGGDVRNSELDVLLPSGRLMNMLGSASPLRDAAGQVRGCVGTFLDITARKQAEDALRESEATLRSFFDSPGAMRGFVEMVDGRIVHVSCSIAAAELFGVDRESISGKSLTEAGVSEEIAHWEFNLYEESRRTGKQISVECARRGADGQERWLLTTVSHLGTRRSGNPLFGYVAIDLTERKRAEEQVRRSEERYRMLFDTLIEGFCIIEVIFDVDVPVDFRFLEINPAFEGLTGLKNVKGLLMRELAPDLEAHWFEIYGHVALTGQPARFVNEAKALNRWYDVSAYRIGEPESRRVAILFNDITERRRAEEALRESEKRFRAQVTASSDVVYRMNPDWSEMRQLRGRDFIADTETPSRTWIQEYIHPDDQPRVLAAIDKAIRTKSIFELEHRVLRVDGALGWTFSRAIPLLDANGEIVEWLGAASDITGRKQAQEALAASENRLHALLDSASQGVVAVDESGRMVLVNAKIEEMFGYTRDELLGQPLEVMLPVGYRTAHGGHLQQYFAHPHTRVMGLGIDLCGRSKNGNEFPMEVSLSCIEQGGSRLAMAIITDITERKKAEERLRQAQKLESLGILAGGVAHDFNNLLVGVIGNASLAQGMLPPDNLAVELLEGVVKAGEQAAHLTRQMLAYSGKGRFMVEPLDLSALIPEMSGLVRPSIPKKITLGLNLDPDLPAVEADRGQVQQVFMNLALNAAEAMGNNAGLISVRTFVQDVDEPYLRLHSEAVALRPGKYVCLEVRDTGCGMDGATKAKVFDPFFTTKFTGRGLGLAAVSGIVRGHKGAITVTSAVGKGSCFSVLFPAVERAVKESPVAARNQALRGAGVVLVVDDERLVREMVKAALEHYGYKVLVADSGLAAIDVLKRHPGDIALVILDLSMPNMSGEEALPELRKIRPEVKVLVSSGYSEAETMTLFKGQQVSGFIQKPYTVKGLAETVKDCLG
jgi:PAS domain S-box-containing protein